MSENGETPQVRTSSLRKKFNRHRLGTGIVLAVCGTILLSTVAVVLVHQYFYVESSDAAWDSSSYRLPQTVQPIRYDLELFPNFYQSRNGESATFNGTVSILLRLRTRSKQIVLHAVGLKIAEVQALASEHESASRTLQKQETWAAQEVQVLTFDKHFEPGSLYWLRMTFRSTLSATSSLGLFYRDYEQPGGGGGNLVATHFQPTYARRVFPCFDEPALKAEFRLRLVRKPGYYSIANTRLNRSESRGDWEVDVFESTPAMSTYLLAFVISNLTGSKTDSGTREYRVWAPAYQLPRAAYSLRVSSMILEYFERWLNKSYSINKLDLVSMPRTKLEAMENWGLVILQDRVMLIDPAVTSQDDTLYLEVVLAHELAHQWFGNLVTLSWWDDLWLNEGLATYMAFTGLQALYKNEQEIDELFVCMYVHSALRKNSDSSAHALDRSVHTPQEISENFSPVHYGKAAALTRMMRFVLSPGTFQTALNRYLSSYQYGNAQRNDFLKALGDQWREERPQEAMDMVEVMQHWISNVGYPVLTIEKVPSAGKSNECEIRISQDHFWLDSIKTKTSLIWDIPFNIRSNSTAWTGNQSFDQHPIHWLRNRTMSKRCSAAEEGNKVWLLANTRHFGFYRTNYDLRNWQLLTEQLLVQPSGMETISRAQLIDDAWNLALAGRLSFEVALNLTRYLVRERQYAPWTAAFTQFDHIESLLPPTRANCSANLKKYMIGLIEPFYNDLQNSDTQSVLSRLINVEITRRACSLGLKKCVEDSKRLFDQEISKGQLNADVGGTYLCVPSNWNAWSSLYDLLKQTGFPPERLNMVRRLIMCTKDSSVLKRFLDLMLSDLQKDALNGTIQELLQNPVGRKSGAAFLKRMLETANPAFLHSIISAFLPPEAIQVDIHGLQEIRLLFSRKQFEQAISSIKSKLLSTLVIEDVCDWLDKQ